MESAPVGRIDGVDANTFKPYVIPVVGYSDEGDEIITKIMFKAKPPFRFVLNMMKIGGKISPEKVNEALLYLDQCVIKSSREDWDRLIDSEDINVEWQTIADV